MRTLASKKRREETLPVISTRFTMLPRPLGRKVEQFQTRREGRELVIGPHIS